MSRSFKKVPGFSDGTHQGLKFAKRLANKKVRHTPVLADGGQYKHAYCSYSIRDWNWRYYSEKEHRRHCEKWGDPLYKARIK